MDGLHKEVVTLCTNIILVLVVHSSLGVQAFTKLICRLLLHMILVSKNKVLIILEPLEPYHLLH